MCNTATKDDLPNYTVILERDIQQFWQVFDLFLRSLKRFLLLTRSKTLVRSIKATHSYCFCKETDFSLILFLLLSPPPVFAFNFYTNIHQLISLSAHVHFSNKLRLATTKLSSVFLKLQTILKKDLHRVSPFIFIFFFL